MASFADGVIVGSALVRALGDGVAAGNGTTALRKLTVQLAEGVRAG